MKSFVLATFAALASAGALPAATAATAAAVVGQPAPAFTAADTAGKPVALADYKGKTVVLEWVNPGCPFVQKHYGSANMQGTQRDATGHGVVWLAINSTATDAGDYLVPAAMARWMQAHNAAASATLMDAEGKVGRAYGARNTPQMFIVDPAGTLVYAGAIDDRPSTDTKDIPGATNHVRQALAQTLAGKAVSTPVTRPYGCSIKYAPGAA